MIIFFFFTTVRVCGSFGLVDVLAGGAAVRMGDACLKSCWLATDPQAKNSTPGLAQRFRCATLSVVQLSRGVLSSLAS